MHYSGMEAGFPAGSALHGGRRRISAGWLAIAVTAVTKRAPSIALVVAVLDNRLEARTSALFKIPGPKPMRRTGGGPATR